MKRTVIAFIIVLAGAHLAVAQTPPVRLTLAEAVARGIESSHRLAEWRAREEAARAVEAQRRASERPQLGLLAGYTRTNHVDEFSVPNQSGGLRVIYPDIPDNYRSRIDLQWPIYTAGRTPALFRAAGAEADAVAQDRDAARADLTLEITRAYWSVLTARASLDVVREALNRIGAHLDAVRNQLSVGLVPPSDVLLIETQQARQQVLHIEAQNLLDTVSAELRRLVGLAPDTPFDLAETLQPPPAPPREVGPLVNLARSSRAERKSIEIRVGAASERIAAAEAGTMPMLAVAGGYDIARPNPRIFPLQEAWKPSWDLRLNFSWSLFDGGRVRAEVAEADANRRAAEERLKDFDATVEVEVRQRTADLASAVASITAADVGVRSATEARRVIAERFSAGVATNTDVLDAQVALLQAELDRTRAIANAQLAAARLDRALGR
jgi:outer membrane protein